LPSVIQNTGDQNVQNNDFVSCYVWWHKDTNHTCLKIKCLGKYVDLRSYKE